MPAFADTRNVALAYVTVVDDPYWREVHALVRVVDFMAASQVPTGPAICAAEIDVAAWRTKPSHTNVVSKRSHLLSPAPRRHTCKRSGATAEEIQVSDTVHVIQPRTLAALIALIAQAATVEGWHR